MTKHIIQLKLFGGYIKFQNMQKLILLYFSVLILRYFTYEYINKKENTNVTFIIHSAF